MQKYYISFYGVAHDSIREFIQIFPYHQIDLQEGLNYFGFFIKTNDYGINDWRWLIAKVEKIIKLWCNKCLSRSGRLLLVKAVLKAILVFWIFCHLRQKGSWRKLERFVLDFLQGMQKIE
jgi:hypothetical protein